MINQLLPTISYGDAVSNSAINMMRVLQSMGYKSQIYAENIHPKMKKVARPFQECPKEQPIIYHLSTGSDLAYGIPNFGSKKMMVYHNVTPSEFFVGYNGTSQILCEKGREQLSLLSSCVDFAFAVSEYNRKELEQLGYNNTVITPIIINYEDYVKKPDNGLNNKLKNDNHITNILFVGRIAPNKKFEDIIKTFYYYKKYVNQNSRLYLVGSYLGMERYYDELIMLVKQLRLDDVYIPGHIPFDQILAYYTNADLFLCMSEHEGFCVPLIEAMHFQIPIIAYKSSAVSETLGNGGFLTLDKDYQSIAELMHIVLSDENIKENLLKNQKERLNYFSKTNTESIFREQIKSFLSS